MFARRPPALINHKLMQQFRYNGTVTCILARHPMSITQNGLQ